MCVPLSCATVNQVENFFSRTTSAVLSLFVLLYKAEWRLNTLTCTKATFNDLGDSIFN